MGLARICIPIERDEVGYPPFDAEIVWGVAREDGRYTIDNIPMFVGKASYKDVVDVERRGGASWFVRGHESSGNSLVRIIFHDNGGMGEASDFLARVCCEFENYAWIKPLMAVSIPMAVDYSVVRDYLERGVRAGLWDFEEARIRG